LVPEKQFIEKVGFCTIQVIVQYRVVNNRLRKILPAQLLEHNLNIAYIGAMLLYSNQIPFSKSWTFIFKFINKSWI